MKKYLIILLVLPILVLLLGLLIDTSATGLRIINAGVAFTGTYDESTDIVYGDQEWQTLDVYSPSVLPTSPINKPQTKKPVIVFFYGGGWSWGDKEYFTFVADSFVRKGYVVVNPNYGLYPQQNYPDFLYDSAKAIKWVTDNIAKHNGDPEQLFLVGHSAGAYNSLMVATNDEYLASEGLKPSAIKGVAGVAGPYNFKPKEQKYIDIFGRDNFEDMKIMNHVNGNEPPTLMIHAKGDTTVGLFNMELMTKALNEQNRPNKTLVYDETINHTSILLKLHPWFADEVSVAEDINRYFLAL